MHRIFATLLLICLGLQTRAADSAWQTLRPGLSYRQLTPPNAFPWSKIHVFRIAPNSHQLQIAVVPAGASSNVRSLAQKHQALIAMNGGFFNPNFKPIGLRISEGKQLSSLKKTSWFGVFYLREGKPYVVSVRDYVPDPAINFAIESGPRLVIKGEIPHLKAGFADRTALGIDRHGAIILLVSEHALIGTQQLAELMAASPQEGGLDCLDALNLDGGGSSQLYANIGGFERHVSGLTDIADALLVLPLS
jgi:uncharacterized protein YigE (DUF2233 family)